MRILVVNFEMDPDSVVLAWQYRIVVRMAAYSERVVVLTQKANVCSLPGNVEVHAIPSWYCKAPFRWMGAKWLANLLLFRLCRRFAFHVCFIHMNMEWAYRFYPCFRWFRIPVLLWYAHGSVSWRLRLAHWCVDRVITSSPDGFRLPSTKTRIIGQGIDTDLFRPTDRPRPTGEVLHVGRISRRKRIELMIHAMAELKSAAPSALIWLRLIGQSLTRDDRRYEAELARLIESLGIGDRVMRTGHVPMDALPKAYQGALVHLNLSTTGSMDKTVLEALACGCPVLTSNVAFVDLFRREGLDMFLVDDPSPGTIARQLLGSFRQQNYCGRAALRNVVLGKHDLSSYVVRVMANIREIAAAGAGGADPDSQDEVRRCHPKNC